MRPGKVKATGSKGPSAPRGRARRLKGRSSPSFSYSQSVDLPLSIVIEAAVGEPCTPSANGEPESFHRSKSYN